MSKSVPQEIREGDCVELMAAMPEATVDAVVTDPPYGLEFMGKGWDRLGAVAEPFQESIGDGGEVDYHGKGNAPFGGGGNRVRYGTSVASAQEWHRAWAIAALRVLKPGGHLLAFGGTRTYHRLACALEDAGFEIRDSLTWVYGSGFPKSLDVSKAIDKAAGAEREPVGGGQTLARGEPATSAARDWQGWGTALKPAHEPIVLARKPLAGTVAGNVEEYGTGALNVDGCRVGTEGRPAREKTGESWPGSSMDSQGSRAVGSTDTGRWPPNLLLSHTACCGEECGPCCPVAEMDRQSGERVSGTRAEGVRTGLGYHGADGDGGPAIEGSTGGASRFFPRFKYQPKASSGERNAGLEGMPEVSTRGNYGNGIQDARPHTPNGYTYETTTRNVHPTVKPIDLMRWLVRLVTPPGGLVLDPFAGSGTTLVAASREGFRCIGIEREAEYAAIARRRFEEDAPLFNRPRHQHEETPSHE